MKRIGVIIASTLAILFLIALLLPPGASRNAPRYVPATGNYAATHYDYPLHNERPFVNDQVWIRGNRYATNQFTCLYDLQERKVLGELLNAEVVVGDTSGTKLLVIGVDSPAVDFKSRLLNFIIKRVSGGRRGFYIPRAESYWVLNLKDNSAKRVGVVKELTGSGTEWFSSPDLRYSCTMPITERPKAVVLFDFARDRLIQFPFDGYICGWWDDQNLLLRDARQDYVLYDVVKRQSTILFSAEMVRQTLEQLKLPSDPTNVIPIVTWNGDEYDFYFLNCDYVRQAKPSFILKAERTPSRPTLKLVLPEIKFELGGRLHAKGTSIVYGGLHPDPTDATVMQGDGAVYLRDLSGTSVLTLVPADDKGESAIPRFYGDEVIYYRDRVLWRIGLDGSNNVPLFPTTNSAANP